MNPVDITKLDLIQLIRVEMSCQGWREGTGVNDWRGGFRLCFYHMSAGGVYSAVQIQGRTDPEGLLHLDWNNTPITTHRKLSAVLVDFLEYSENNPLKEG